MSEDPEVKVLRQRILALEGALENTEALYVSVEREAKKIESQRDEALKGVNHLAKRIERLENSNTQLQGDLELERLRSGTLQETLGRLRGERQIDHGLLRLLQGIDEEPAQPQTSLIPGVVKLEAYELEDQLEDWPDVREKLLLLDQFATLPLSPFMDLVAQHLSSNVSMYSILGDEFVRIYTSDKDLKFEKVARSDGLVMSALLDRPPGIYKGTIMPESMRLETQEYIGLHVCPPMPQRRRTDPAQDPPRLVINICPKKGKSLTASDRTFLRMLQPLISNGLHMTQRMALLQRDEQGYIEDKDYFYENVKDRIRRTGQTGKRYGVIMTDLDDFEKFNNLAGHAIGDMVLDRMRKRIREVIRSDDVTALKSFAFSLKVDGGAYVLSDETAQKDGDESCIVANVEDLGGLVVVGHRVQQEVADINVYQVFLDYESENSDFDAKDAYEQLCRAAPYMLDDEGRYRCRLSVGVNMLEPPTDQELDDDGLLSAFAKRAVFHADQALIHAKQLVGHKTGYRGLRAIGYHKLVVDAERLESRYEQGHLDDQSISAIRSAYRQIRELQSMEESSRSTTQEVLRLRKFVDQELMDNLVPGRQESLSLSSTNRYPLSDMRSATQPD